MKERMQRFLKSIEIESPERFDLDFDFVRRNDFVHDQIDMMIVKDTPWEYSLLDEFMSHLETIKYPYDMHFSYRQRPTIYEAIQLFDEWFRNHNRYPNPLKLEAIHNDTIRFIYSSEEEKEKFSATIKEFKEFLDFLNYLFEFEDAVEEKAPEIKELSPKKLEKINDKALKAAEEDSGEEENESSYYKDSKEIEEENKVKELRELETQYLSEMKENLKQMKKDYKKGKSYSEWRDSLPYVHFDDLNAINPKSGNVDICGEVFGIDKPPKINRGEKMFQNFGLGSGNAALSVKAVENEFLSREEIETLKNGMHIRIRGYAEADRFNGQLVINAKGYEKLPPEELRNDDEEQKRVELHLHTKMSTMDGVTSISEYVKLAKHMGHRALAITDHGVTQCFPEAQEISEKEGLDLIYGSELYMVNDELPFALNPKDIKLQGGSYVVFDLETTGLSARYDRITEFGGVRYENGQVTKHFDILINPEMAIPLKIQEKTKITQDLVKNQPTIDEVMPQILEFFGDSIVVSHNINFDLGFINEALRREGKEPLPNPAIDTLSLSRYMFPEARAHNLGALSRNLGMSSYDENDAHRADYDAEILSEVWQTMLNRLTQENMELKHSDLAKFKVTTLMYKHMRPAHVCVLCKNKAGLHDLNKLVSDSHTKYLADVPKTPKTELIANRSNLLVGSACLNGDVFEAAMTRSKDVLKKMINFYDYIEVQPPANYTYLVNRGEVDNLEEIQMYIKDIIEAAEEMGKIVVATGDVHYANPKDKMTRDIFIASKGIGGKAHPLHLRSNAENPDQHFRTTKEMLDAFAFLGKDKAFEIVVTNTNKIVDSIEIFKPFDNKLRQPVIENSPEILRSVTEEKAKEYYGDPIPDFIQERLNKELNGIIGNGYSVTYYIARRIVQEANSKGFMVGSRGSVGSSFAAHLFGITEVNPLPPHYRCPKCKHYEFVKDANILSGYDLPDKVCPVCGEPMIKDGQNIPFETFLGFEGDKVPDIDLNFPSDYQQQAFDYTKVVFGENNVFRAGTIETVAAKTAFGYVRAYFEDKFIKENSLSKEQAEEMVNKMSTQLIAYYASHCTDVKRTTGQHPGGIVVLPKGMSIYDFTPIQYPADDKESTWFTTHLDYHGALDKTLLKLDLLGHVDPMALRLMTEMTGLDVKKIPLNDAKVISLFYTDKALNRNGNYLHAITGAAGLPEFGTETGNDILLDAKPRSFADLVIIAGLAHGTDVWAHNAQDLIRNGTCTIRDVIGCRDDIMTYLISMGLPNKVSFKIMEDVRKGKKLKPEYEQEMLAHKVPQWYLDSCNKIKYMFPKAHAVAYVTMAVRVGYFKVYYPLEFYAVWFSVRCKAYDINAMLGGLESIIARYEEIKRKQNNRAEKISPKEKDLLGMLKVAIEMCERGYKFENIDLYKSEATNFVVDHEKKSLIPPFIVLDGLGDAAAETVVEARKDGEFKTKEDLLRRTKLNSTNVDDLDKLGVLAGLGDTDQMSLFDFGLEFDS